MNWLLKAWEEAANAAKSLGQSVINHFTTYPPLVSPVADDNWGSSPTPTPTAVPTPTPTPTPIPWYVKNVPIEQRPYHQDIAKAWGNAAGIAHQILRWVDPVTGTIRGENVSYMNGPEMDKRNKDGSTDRGLFRINSRTFADYMRRMPNKLRQLGITNWDDMLNPLLNARMARLIYHYQGAGAWVAAPPRLKRRQ